MNSSPSIPDKLALDTDTNTKVVTPLSRIVTSTFFTDARQALGAVPEDHGSLHDDAAGKLRDFLHQETTHLPVEVADIVARGVIRINGALTVPHSLLGHNGMASAAAYRVRNLLSALGIVEECNSFDLLSPINHQSKKPQPRIIHKTHFHILDALMHRILGVDENGKRIEQKGLPNTYLIHTGRPDFIEYIETLFSKLSFSGADSYWCEDARAMRAEAMRAEGRTGWNATLKILQQDCARDIKKGRPSVLFVPLDKLQCFKKPDSTILTSYVLAIEGARKKGKTILLVSQKVSDTHRCYFGDELYRQLFGTSALVGQGDPKYVTFSPRPCEIERHNQAHIFQLLYETTIQRWNSDPFFSSIPPVATLPLFRHLDPTPTAQKEIDRRIHFLHQLSLFIALRGKTVETISPITHQKTPSEMEKLLEQIELSKYKFTPQILEFIQKTLQVNCNPIQIRRYLWRQYCLLTFQTGRFGNALERSAESLNEAFSPSDRLGIEFEYFLAKTVFRDHWNFSGLEGVTSWSEADLAEFEELNRGKTDILEGSLNSLLIPPEPFKDESGAVVLDPLDFVLTKKA